MDAVLFQEPRRRTIAIDSRAGGGVLSALDFGDPERPIDVVFVHANGFNALTYRTILSPLAAGLRILAIDQRGHGETLLPGDPAGRRSWDDLRDDLVGLMDALARTPEGQGPMVFSGHSMGGSVSLLAAAARPGRAKALVLFDPVVMPRGLGWYARLPWTASVFRRQPIAQGALRRRSVFDSRSAAFDAYKGRGAFKTWPDAVLADYVEGGFVDRPDGKVELACAPEWEASSYVAQGSDVWGAARRVRCPVRLLRAAHGSTSRIGTGAGFGGGRFDIAVVEGSSHFLPMERPELVREALLAAGGG